MCCRRMRRPCAVPFRLSCGAVVARDQLVWHRRRLHSTAGATSLERSQCLLGMKEEEALLLAQLSEALFRDEAVSTSLTLPDSSGCEVRDDEVVLQTQMTLQDCMDVALDPQGASSASLDGASPLARSLQELSHCRHSSDSSTALAGALCAFITSDASVWNRAASELLLVGTDMKALFPDGTLRGLRVEQKCLSQCDFSTMSFLSVRATRVDFSRSLFYTTALHDTVFVDCCFDGCVLKELRCTGSVRFDGCSFRFASIALRIARGGGTGGAGAGGDGKTATRRVVFERCDFDLADFSHSDHIPAQCFINCYNTHLAAKFPPQVG